MRYARGTLAILLAILLLPEARAQIGLSLRGRHLSATFVVGGPYGFGGWGRPYVYGRPWWGPRYNGFVFVQPRIVQPAPVIINNPPPIIIQPQPPQVDLIDPIVIQPRNQPPARAEAPLPGAPRGEFRPVLPEDRDWAENPPRPPLRNQPPRRRVEPAEDARADAARLLDQGKQAFAAQQYAQAEGRFRQAAALRPDDPLTFFLLAEAQFALGKYQEADASIHAGLRLKPDWPAARFRPIELYGANVADYVDHLDQLRDALRRNPQDPVLLFLLAYQLWFDGQKEEARELFRQAAAGVVDPSFIDLFLRQGLPGDRVVRR